VPNVAGCGVPAVLRRQLTYKTCWYGSTLAVLDRWWPSSKTCFACGWKNPRLNIAAHAVPFDRPVAPGKGETQNARGAPVRPPGPQAGQQEAMKREDIGPPRSVPPQRSNPLTLPTLNDIGHETAKRP
jgi:putative transposase